jgi:NOL1/NOP2/fmu family ribosome biogenesis protein
MQKLKILNTRDKKEISKLIKKQFGCKFDFNDYAVFMNRYNKIYIINKEISLINFNELKINSIGLYFGEINVNQLRLSIEGSQIIGKIATKNVFELDDKQAKQWMKGIDLEIDFDKKGFVIIKNNDDFLGCGKFVKSKLLNYVPKNRRV